MGIAERGAPDLDVLSWTINLVRKKLSSVITSPQALFFLDSPALAQLQMLDQKLVQFQSILDEKADCSRPEYYSRSESTYLFLKKVKRFIHHTEDFVEQVEWEMCPSDSEASGGVVVAVSSTNEMELDKHELDVKQSRVNRKRNCSYVEELQEIIGTVDEIVATENKFLLDDLSSASQKGKRPKALHEGNTSKTSGELSDRMHGMFLNQVSELGSVPNVFPGGLTEKLLNGIDEIICGFKFFRTDEIPRYPHEEIISHENIVGRSKDVRKILRILFSERDRMKSGISVLAPDLDVLSWAINLVRKKLSSVITSPQALFFLDSPALAQLQMLDQKLVQFQSILDEKADCSRSESTYLFLKKVKRFIHHTEDFVEQVEWEMCPSDSEASGGVVVAVSSTNEMELDKHELDVKQSRVNRKRNCSYVEELQEIIGTVDEIVATENKFLLDDLSSASQKGKRPKALHEGNTSKTSGELSDRMHGMFLNQVSELGSVPNVFPGGLTEKLLNGIDEIICGFKFFRTDEIPRYPHEEIISHENIVGRSKDVRKILRILFSERDRMKSGISVLAVTGMGGLGKTRLAQLVFDHPKVRNHFNLRLWAFVGKIDFDVSSLIKRMLESITLKHCGLVELSSLRSELNIQVAGKSFFLVLDDVWNVNQSIWEVFMSSLCSARFVHVIVTTRNIGVARMVQTVGTYSLGYLTYDDSWSLFKFCAFRDGEVPSYANAGIINIAKIIVKKCKGSPLLVKLIGSLLKYRSDLEFWRHISVTEDLWEYTEEFLPVIKISYDQLPPILKLFFTMFSLFPKDYVFSKNSVTKLWMALDFFESEINRPLEETASKYFEELVGRNLIEYNTYGGARRNGFIMHDMVHDLAKFLAGEECASVEAGQQIPLASNFGSRSEYGMHSRYFSIIVNNLPQAVNLQPLQEYQQLRSLQIINNANKWNGSISIHLSDELFQFLRHLRILDLSYTGIEALPDTIRNLKQLRYLNLTKTKISKLPESISYLFNLETLELQDCSLQELPQGITRLIKLRHLNFFDKNTCMPRGIGCLTDLQTLPVLNIKRGHWHCKISELKGLMDLQKKLTITGLRNVSSAEAAKEANLQSKGKLEILVLDWSNTSCTSYDHYKIPSFEATTSGFEQPVELELVNIDQVFENLQPNSAIKELSIIDYLGSRFPNWFGDVSFCQLTKITLKGCGDNCHVLPSLGLLPSLKSLYILWHRLRLIAREFCSHELETKGFQSLETLEFKYMPNWVKWCGVENGEFCRLNALRIVCCNVLRFLPEPLSSSLKTLLISKCGELSVLPFLPSLTKLTLSGQLSETLLYNLQLPSLQFLNITCTKSLTFLELTEWVVPSLHVLVIKGCKYLQSIAGISSITSLKHLEIVRCRAVQISLDEDIPPLLQHLTIVRCHWLQEWHQLISMRYNDQLKSKSTGSISQENRDGEYQEALDEMWEENSGDEMDVEVKEMVP